MMNLRIPPVIQVLIIGLAMWLVARLAPALNFMFDGRSFLSAAIWLVAILIAGVALAGFGAAKTTVNPTSPQKTSDLVTGGIYSVTRNPMYLGIALLLASFAIYLGNPLNVLPLAFFIWFITEFQIKPEERVLREIFGKAYDEYCSRVRRWI